MNNWIVATRHLIPICYNQSFVVHHPILVATRHLIPICYNATY